MTGFAETSCGRQLWGPHTRVPRHRHDHAYAALLLSGSYEECGSRGRFLVGAGVVLFHEAFDDHLDRILSSGAQILNLRFDRFSTGPDIFRVADADAIVRAAERDETEASAELRAQLCPIERVYHDWPDALAEQLLIDPDCRLGQWARDNSLAPPSVSRGFRKVFGVTPAAFRCEARARRALTMIRTSPESLAVIAAKVGFADQAHMSRAVRALTGLPPGAWRGRIQAQACLSSAGSSKCAADSHSKTARRFQSSLARPLSLSPASVLTTKE